jgi:drug/metabolite transporter (DMT)-like permease
MSPCPDSHSLLAGSVNRVTTASVHPLTPAVRLFRCNNYPVILGYFFAVLAAMASGSGSILESLGIRRAGVYGGTSLDLVSLRRQAVYFVGLGVDMLGFLCAAAALHRLPLFLVQSLLAFSVAVTATISAFMGTRLATAGWVALGIGAAGLVMLAWSADPGPARALAPSWRWILLGMALPVAAIAIYAKRRNRSWTALALAFGAGVSFCVVGVSARTLNIPDSPWRLVLDPTIWAIVLNGLTAAVVFAMALQKSGATAITAVMFTTNTTLSSLIGVAYLDDRVRSGFAAVAIGGFVLAIAGAITVAHYASAGRGAGISVGSGRVKIGRAQPEYMQG